uniref:Uncharacterized protein n=1 Tax=Brassica oleracea var. oleracea TaxID=109376 RepID=A0A0D3ADT1_BRAOL
MRGNFSLSYATSKAISTVLSQGADNPSVSPASHSTPDLQPEVLATRAVGEIPSSNNLRLQNLVESQLEITKTESCLIALSAKFAPEVLFPMPLA